MNSERTFDRYSATAQFFHWMSALLVAIAWTLGQTRDDFARGEPRRLVDFAHVSSGQIILTLLLLRLIWRLVSPPPPKQLTSAGVWGVRAANLAQTLLYILLLAAPAAGVITLFAEGKPLPLFGLATVPSPWIKDKALEHTAKEIHEWLANGLILIALLHAGAALTHHFRLKDDTLRRMLPRWIG